MLGAGNKVCSPLICSSDDGGAVTVGGSAGQPRRKRVTIGDGSRSSSGIYDARRRRSRKPLPCWCSLKN